MTKTVRAKDLIKEIEEIKVKTYELKQIVEAMPPSSVKTVFDYSVKKLEKNLDRYTLVNNKMTLSAEEIALVNKFREEKNPTLSQIPDEQSIIKIANSMYPMKKQKKY